MGASESDTATSNARRRTDVSTHTTMRPYITPQTVSGGTKHTAPRRAQTEGHVTQSRLETRPLNHELGITTPRGNRPIL